MHFGTINELFWYHIWYLVHLTAVTEPKADIAGGGPAGVSAAAGAVVMDGSTMSVAEVVAGARVVEGVPLRL